jgi:hypothetical protein
MGKATKNKQSRAYFVAVFWIMLNGKAYKKLPASASKMLPYFLGKVHDKDFFHPDSPGRYDFTFPFTYSEAKRLGFGRSTFYKVLRDLTRFGFIDVVKKGGLRSGG